MGEVTELEYTVEFNREVTANKFKEVVSTHELFNDVDISYADAEEGGFSVHFTFPRIMARKFEFFRKRFSMKHAKNFVDRITTTSLYK